MTKTCPECGYPVPLDIQTCPECGYPFPVEQTITPKHTTSNTINSSTHYQTLSREQVNLYTKGSPIIISAMALLKDTATGQIIGQVKYQNISPAPLKALIINIKAFDVMGQELEGIQKFQYLDLDVKRDDFFGANIPIIFPDSQTRIFSIEILNVLTGFGSVQDLSGMTWNKLMEPVRINQKYNDSEFIKQYSIELGPQAKYEHHNEEDLWYCVCGTYNKQTEPLCHSCNISREKLLQTELVEINAQKEKRLQKEEQARLERERHWEEQRLKREQEKLEQEQFLKEQKEKKALKRKKIIKRITILLVVIILVSLAIIGFPKAKAYIEPKIAEYKYNKALTLIEAGQYEEGYEILLNGKYDNAEELVKQSKYDRATALISEKKYEDAYLLLEEIGDSLNAEELLKQGKYDHALTLVVEKKYEDAYQLFSDLGDYSDAKDQLINAKLTQATEYQQAGDNDSAIELLNSINSASIARSSLTDEQKYVAAILYRDCEKYVAATEIFSQLGSYKDSTQQYIACKQERDYVSALDSINLGLYDRALENLEHLSGYKDSDELLKKASYFAGIKYFNTGVYQHAIAYFETAGDYENAAEKLAEAQNLLKQEKNAAAQQAAKRAAEQKAAQEAQRKALLEEFKKGKALKYTTRNEFKNRQFTVHSVIAKLSEDEKTYTIFVDCTLPKDMYTGIFNPPDGDIFKMSKNNGKEGRHTYTYTIPRAKLKSVKEVTNKYTIAHTKTNKDVGWMFFKTDQLY